MKPLNENAIEQNLIELLPKQGYAWLHSSELERSLDGVVLEEHYKASLKKLNPVFTRIRLRGSLSACDAPWLQWHIMANNEKYGNIGIC